MEQDPRFLGTVWAPLRNKSGGKVQSWEMLTEVNAGDIVIHYAKSAIRGFSVVTTPAILMERPNGHSEHWDNEGRGLIVDLVQLDLPISLEEISVSVRLAENFQSPFDKNGNVKQGYLYRVFPELKRDLEALLDASFDHAPNNEKISTIHIDGDTDGEGVAAYRREQPRLRKYLLKNRSTGNCGICGVELPSDYLVAAHIKKRSLASESERKDLNIVFLACKFGCDTAFELGHIQVDQQGKILLPAAAPLAIKEKFKNISGQLSPAFSSSNKKYFAAHRNSFNSHSK